MSKVSFSTSKSTLLLLLKRWWTEILNVPILSHLPLLTFCFQTWSGIHQWGCWRANDVDRPKWHHAGRNVRVVKRRSSSVSGNLHGIMPINFLVSQMTICCHLPTIPIWCLKGHANLPRTIVTNARDLLWHLILLKCHRKRLPLPPRRASSRGRQ